MDLVSLELSTLTFRLYVNLSDLVNRPLPEGEGSFVETGVFEVSFRFDLGMGMGTDSFDLDFGQTPDPDLVRPFAADPGEEHEIP